VALLTAGLTCACAGPKFYTLENGKEHETGIPIYPTKIFLVVSYTNAKDHPVEVTLVRIPDRTQEPIYARELRGSPLRSGHGQDGHPSGGDQAVSGVIA